MLLNTREISPKDEDLGRITTPAIIGNNFDIRLARTGAIPEESIRRVEVSDALVDTGASSLCLPASMVRELGLEPLRQRNARTAGGMRVLTVFSEVQLKIQDRDTVVRVTEIPDGSPVLIGQIPLEDMDLVPFPKEQKLLPNPAHGGEWEIEIW